MTESGGRLIQNNLRHLFQERAQVLAGEAPVERFGASHEELLEGVNALRHVRETSKVIWVRLFLVDEPMRSSLIPRVREGSWYPEWAPEVVSTGSWPSQSPRAGPERPIGAPGATNRE